MSGHRIGLKRARSEMTLIIFHENWPTPLVRLTQLWPGPPSQDSQCLGQRRARAPEASEKEAVSAERRRRLFKRKVGVLNPVVTIIELNYHNKQRPMQYDAKVERRAASKTAKVFENAKGKTVHQEGSDYYCCCCCRRIIKKFASAELLSCESPPEAMIEHYYYCDTAGAAFCPSEEGRKSLSELDYNGERRRRRQRRCMIIEAAPLEYATLLESCQLSGVANGDVGEFCHESGERASKGGEKHLVLFKASALTSNSRKPTLAQHGSRPQRDARAFAWPTNVVTKTQVNQLIERFEGIISDKRLTQRKLWLHNRRAASKLPLSSALVGVWKSARLRLKLRRKLPAASLKLITLVGLHSSRLRLCQCEQLARLCSSLRPPITWQQRRGAAGVERRKLDDKKIEEKGNSLLMQRPQLQPQFNCRLRRALDNEAEFVRPPINQLAGCCWQCYLTAILAPVDSRGVPHGWIRFISGARVEDFVRLRAPFPQIGAAGGQLNVREFGDKLTVTQEGENSADKGRLLRFIVVRERRQVYDYICIDCNHVPALFARSSSGRVGLQMAPKTRNFDAQPPGDKHRRQREPFKLSHEPAPTNAKEARATKVCHERAAIRMIHSNAVGWMLQCNWIMAPIEPLRNRRFITDAEPAANLCYFCPLPRESLNNRAAAELRTALGPNETAKAPHYRHYSELGDAIQSNNGNDNNAARRRHYNFYYYYYYYCPNHYRRRSQKRRSRAGAAAVDQERRRGGGAEQVDRTSKLITRGSGPGNEPRRGNGLEVGVPTHPPLKAKVSGREKVAAWKQLKRDMFYSKPPWQGSNSLRLWLLLLLALACASPGGRSAGSSAAAAAAAPSIIDAGLLKRATTTTIRDVASQSLPAKRATLQSQSKGLNNDDYDDNNDNSLSNAASYARALTRRGYYKLESNLYGHNNNIDGVVATRANGNKLAARRADCDKISLSDNNSGSCEFADDYSAGSRDTTGRGSGEIERELSKRVETSNDGRRSAAATRGGRRQLKFGRKWAPVGNGQRRLHSGHEQLGARDRLFESEGSRKRRRRRRRTRRSSTSNREMLANGRRLSAAAVATARPRVGVDANLSSGQWCPSECICVWKNGKQFADCSQGAAEQRANLSAIPSGLDPLLQVLNMSTNHLVHLPASAFVSLNLNNLQRIYLSNCQLESVHPRAFENLKLVVELDFSWNKLNSVPLLQMKQLALMRRLTMRGNPLFALTDSTLTAPPESNKKRTRGSRIASEPSNVAGRLVESYPDLARLLSQQQQQEQSSADNSIIKTFARRGGSASATAELDEEAGKLRQLVQQLSGDAFSSGAESSGEDDENQLLESPLASNELSAQQANLSLGALFRQLQELDFGHCQLHYIKWNTFANLNQLKRLLLDGNHLSQLSGRLIELLPSGLHQLSLEENPWTCDCRLLSLKRWLLETRTPLSGQARCQFSPGMMRETRNKSRKARLTSETSKHLDQLALEDFVCAPQATFADHLLAEMSSNAHKQPEPLDNSFKKFPLKLAAVYQYLEPTLIGELQFDEDLKPISANQTSKFIPSVSLASKQSDLIRANEGDKIALSCAMLAYPDTSLEIVWLADYNQFRASSWSAPKEALQLQLQLQPQLSSVGRLPAEERFVVLYDSKLHRAKQQQESPQESGDVWREANLYGSRMLVRESAHPDGQLGILKQSQIIIQAAHVDDSARYKCIAFNRAGNSSAEFLVRVEPDLSGRVVAPLGASESSRDQRANSPASNRNSASVVLNKNRLGPQPSVQPDGNAANLGNSGSWLKSATTFRITIVVVSILMAGVIIAFLLFCVVIYQIKPNASNAWAALNQRKRAQSLNDSSSCAPPDFQANQRNSQTIAQSSYQQPQPVMYGLLQGNLPLPLNARLTAVCDPISGQAPIHLIGKAQPVAVANGLQLASRPQVSSEENVASWLDSNGGFASSTFSSPTTAQNTLHTTQPIYNL